MVAMCYFLCYNLFYEEHEGGFFVGLFKQSKKKVSIDFTEDAYQLLSERAQKIGVSNSVLVNFLVETFLGMSDTQKKWLVRFCIERLRDENNKVVSNDFEIQERTRKIKQYSDIINFFAKYDKTMVLENMDKIDMANGYIIYPEDWIVLDYQKPEWCEYAGVVSIRNNHVYNVPIFLFFSDTKIKDLSKDEEEAIYRKCIGKYPDFRKILTMQVTLAYDSEGNLLNGELWDKAPTIGIFQIAEYGKDNVYPYGAMVVPEDE